MPVFGATFVCFNIPTVYKRTVVQAPKRKETLKDYLFVY